MVHNEHSSKALATIAARVLHKNYTPTPEEIRSLAASVLTQTPNHEAIVAEVKAEKK